MENLNRMAEMSGQATVHFLDSYFKRLFLTPRPTDERVTRKQELTGYHNDSMHELIAYEISVANLKQYDLKEKISERQVGVIKAPDGTTKAQMMKVTVEEVLKEKEEEFKKEQVLFKVTKELLDKEQ